MAVPADVRLFVLPLRLRLEEPDQDHGFVQPPQIEPLVRRTGHVSVTGTRISTPSPFAGAKCRDGPPMWRASSRPAILVGGHHRSSAELTLCSPAAPPASRRMYVASRSVSSTPCSSAS